MKSVHKDASPLAFCDFRTGKKKNNFKWLVPWKYEDTMKKYASGNLFGKRFLLCVHICKVLMACRGFSYQFS